MSDEEFKEWLTKPRKVKPGDNFITVLIRAIDELDDKEADNETDN